MSKWLTLFLGAACVLWALVHLRLLVLFIRNRHTTTEAHPAGTAEAAISGIINSGLTAAALSAVFLLVPWPRNILYAALVIVIRCIIDLVLFSMNVGVFVCYAPGNVSAGARLEERIKQIIKLVFAIAVFGLLLLFTRRG